MFTGIVEEMGIVKAVEMDLGNLHLTMAAEFADELKVDQSIAHNGVCLTVVNKSRGQYGVTAIKETIEKTTIGNWKVGDLINLERGLKLGDRLDGHMVQGHVDQIGKCISMKENDGSWMFRFQYEEALGNFTIEKGSITVNGVSLTVVDSDQDSFGVAIIPFTYEHTNFFLLKEGSLVNLEFDLIGKYVSRLHKNTTPN